MTIQDLKNQNLILLECISGSKAYGLDTPTSDTDIKGVYYLPKESFFGLNYIPQIANSTNDIVYYELGRYIELLSVNNPNILELLNTPKSHILIKDSRLDILKPEIFISKLCLNSFGRFAIAQLKKARGLKKKIVNPMSKERKTPLNFCFVNSQEGSLSLSIFLARNKWKQENCGLVKMTNMKDIYGLYHDKQISYRGILSSEEANDISLSSIPKGAKQKTVLYFNRDGYSKYCKDYKEYWQWVEKRNDERYKSTKSHGKNYDAKNMMHTFRLLEMAIEIAEQGKINVARPNRDYLLQIKNGEFEYDVLVKQAEELNERMKLAFEKSDLPIQPNLVEINSILVSLRDQLYN